MRSFDFYDTLVTRLVAAPADIFSLVAERLAIPHFRTMRIAAECAARRTVAGGEVRLEQIYAHIPLDPQEREKARLLELEFERTLVAPVTAVLSRFRSGDIIVSDMYHDEALFREVLERLAPGLVPGGILISSSAGLSKRKGELWRRVVREYPGYRSHIGDNPIADVKQARRNGLHAEHFTGMLLNRYEEALAQAGGDGCMIAGASRGVRATLVRTHCSPTEGAVIGAFASVVSPLLYAFTDWVMRACLEEGIEDVYFLARDGQLPSRIFSRLSAQNGQNIRSHYIYASRQALHLPGCSSIDDAEDWLLEGTPNVTLRAIAERAMVPLGIAIAAARHHLSAMLDDEIGFGQREILRTVIRERCFVEAFNKAKERAFEASSAYFLGLGLGAKKRIAVVDVGWNGRLQRSLGRLLSKSGNRPERILGLYLCLSRRVPDEARDELRGFLSDPNRPDRVRFFDRYRGVIESILSADHPGIVGFRVDREKPVPVFGQPYAPATQQRISLEHRVVDAFFENLLILGRAVERPITPCTSTAVANLIRFLRHPSEDDGRAFEGFNMVEGQTGSVEKPICQRIRISQLLRKPGSVGFWPEGSLSLSRLRVCYFLYRVFRDLRLRF